MNIYNNINFICLMKFGNILFLNILNFCMTIRHLKFKLNDTEIEDSEKDDNDNNIISNHNNSKYWKTINLGIYYLNKNVATEKTKKQMFFPNTEEINWFKNNLMNPLITKISKLIKIYRDGKPIDFPEGCYVTNKIKTDEDFLTLRKGNDIIFFIMFEDFGLISSAKVQMFPCKMSFIDNLYYRPSIGILKFNSRKLPWNSNFFQRENFLNTIKRSIFHQMLHFLVFSKELQKYYIDQFGNNLLKSKPDTFKDNFFHSKHSVFTLITSKEIKNYTREYFNCPEAEGYPIQYYRDNGVTIFHLNQQLILDNIMIKIFDYPYFKFSKLVGMILNLSGWYKVDLNKLPETSFGKNKGCDFYNLNCKNTLSGHIYDEFCENEDEKNCDYYYTSKSICKRNKESFCKVFLPYKRGSCDFIDPMNLPFNPMDFEYFGSDQIDNKGKCIFSRSHQIPFCIRSQCNFEKKLIIFYIGNQTYIGDYSVSNFPKNLYFKFIHKMHEFEFKYPDFDRFCFEFTHNKIKII